MSFSLNAMFVFIDFLANLSKQAYFFNGPSLYAYHLMLVISLFFKV